MKKLFAIALFALSLAACSASPNTGKCPETAAQSGQTGNNCHFGE